MTDFLIKDSTMADSTATDSTALKRMEHNDMDGKEQKNEYIEKDYLDKDTVVKHNEKEKLHNFVQIPEEEEMVTCYLCKRWFTKPRVLPCMHSFCETCLENYIMEELPTNDSGKDHAFRCPRCKFKVIVKNQDIPKESWIKLMPPHTLLVNIVENLRMERTTNCDPCGRGEEEAEATSWCRDCGEALCEKCAIYHKRVKLLMDHIVSSFDEVRKKHHKLADKTEICHQHKGKNVEAVCLSHDKLCCVDCVAYIHQKCKRVLPITDIAKDIKRSKYIKELMERMKTIDAHVIGVVQSREGNSEDLRHQQHNILTEVVALRDSIKQHIDAMESRLQQEFDIMHNALLKKLELQSTEFQCRHSSIANGQKVLNASLLHGTEENTFVVSHKLKKLCEEHERFIKTESHRIYRHDYNLNIHDVLSTFREKIADIAKINITKQATNVIPAFMKDMVALEVGEINGRVASDKFHPWFTSGLFLPDGKVVLVDFKNKKVKCFDLNNQLTSELFMESQPWGIMQIRLNELVITMPEEAEMIFIVVDGDGILTLVNDKIKTLPGCHGIHGYDERMAVACSSEVRIMTTSGELERKIFINDRGTRYVNLDAANMICYTTKKSIVCVSLKGKTEFEYSDKELKSPRGIARDKEGNYYVCGMDSNNVHQLSSEGKLIKVILSSPEHSIRNPYAIGFEPRTTRMFVTQMDCDVVKIYKLVTMWH